MKIDKRFTFGMILGLLIIITLACTNTVTTPIENKKYTWIEIQDGCQYVLAKPRYTTGTGGIGIVHHAACNNPIHNKE